MKCIAIDDERPALDIIQNFCQRIGNIEVKTFTNPLVGMDEMRCFKPDILFLDVEMGGINGVELAKKLPPGVFLVFTTAYAEYALDGFELNAVDFLHKPFSFSRFEKAIQKAVELKKLHEMQGLPSDHETIVLKAEYKQIPILLSDIVYIESMGNYVRVHLINKQTVLSQVSMKNIIELLPSDRFVRIHKSFVIARIRMASCTKKQVTLYGGIELPIGRNYAANLEL